MQKIKHSKVLLHAKTLWDFLCEDKSRAKCDLIVACGSYDLRVCDYACELLKNGFANKLIVSGNTGNWTKFLWSAAEADIFYDRALEQGILPSSIIIENKATNLSENVLFSCQLMPHVKNIIFITKPNTVKRLHLSIAMSHPNIHYFVDAPSFEFPWGVSNAVGVLGLIEEMVGDLHRIIEYPKKGFQKSCEIPFEVIESWKYLISEGFNRHLI